MPEGIRTALRIPIRLFAGAARPRTSGCSGQPLRRASSPPRPLLIRSAVRQDNHESGETTNLVSYRKPDLPGPVAVRSTSVGRLCFGFPLRRLFGRHSLSGSLRRVVGLRVPDVGIPWVSRRFDRCSRSLVPEQEDETSGHTPLSLQRCHCSLRQLFGLVACIGNRFRFVRKELSNRIAPTDP